MMQETTKDGTTYYLELVWHSMDEKYEFLLKATFLQQATTVVYLTLLLDECIAGTTSTSSEAPVAIDLRNSSEMGEFLQLMRMEP